MAQLPTTPIPAAYYFPFTVYVVVARTPGTSTDETDVFESGCHASFDAAQAAVTQLARGKTRASIAEIVVEGAAKAPAIRREWQCVHGSCHEIQRAS
jgi:hypothetical protein